MKWKLAGVGVGLTLVAFGANAVLTDKPVVEKKAHGSDEVRMDGEESLFAEIQDGIVVRVIVAEPEVINSGLFGDPENWVRTYANGRIRANYSGIGHTYDKDRDVFIAPKPDNDAVLDEKTFRWVLPEAREEKI